MRSEGGRFESIYDLVERVPTGILNRRVIESLALAGAFDCFQDIKREDYFQRNMRDESFSELLLRYGQQFQNAKQEQTASLFGFDESFSDTAARPPVTPAVAWMDIVRLEKERELVGMYLSAHPLDPYYMEIKYGCTSCIKDLTDETPVENQEMTFAGMVVDYMSKPSQRGGNFGIMKIEDYSATTELRLFGQQYIDFNKFGEIGTPIIVTGRWQKRFNSSELRFNITNIRLLEEVKGQMVSGLTISTDMSSMTDSLKDILLDRIKNTTSGGVNLNFKVFDPSINRSVTLNSQYKMDIDRSFLEELENMEVSYDIVRAS